MDINHLGLKVTYIKESGQAASSGESVTETENIDALEAQDAVEIKKHPYTDVDTDSFEKSSLAEDRATAAPTQQDKAHVAYLNAIQQALTLVKKDLG